MFNSYYIKARLFPTLITCIPLVILINYLSAGLLTEKFKEVNTFTVAATNTSISVALVFLLVLINRFVSKEIFQRWLFQDEMYMPSTSYLLYSNLHYDLSIKEQIRNKMESKYTVKLMNHEDEKVNQETARKLLVVVISQVRNDLRENKMLLQHNIEYGFFRNLIGGSLIAFFASFTLILYSAKTGNSALQYSGIFLSILYLFPLLGSKTLINKHGNYYAKILFEQFLSLK